MAGSHETPTSYDISKIWVCCAQSRACIITIPTMASSSSSSSPAVDGTANSLVERAQNFVSEHKKAVLLTAAAVTAAAGVAYYVASTSRRPPGHDEVKGSDGEGRKKKRSKSTKKNGKSRGVDDPNGPLLEERKPNASVSEGGGTCRGDV